jgi:hypothetical protein
LKIFTAHSPTIKVLVFQLLESSNKPSRPEFEAGSGIFAGEEVREFEGSFEVVRGSEVVVISMGGDEDEDGDEVELEVISSELVVESGVLVEEVVAVVLGSDVVDGF